MLRFGGWPRRLVAVAAALALGVVLAACGGSSAPTLTLYSAQHQDIVDAWLAEFTKDTGIKVEVRRGGDFQLANQIATEGDASPADVFITENSPALSLLSSQGRLAELPQSTLDQVPAKYRSGAGDWVGIAARSTVLIYNTSMVTPEQLPKSITELADPAWQGRVGVAPGGADFQAIVSAVYAVNGAPAAGHWLEGLKRNARPYQNNIAIMKAVNAGEVPAGVIYHYYWYKDQVEGKVNSANTALQFWGDRDAGAFISVSGGAVIASSKHPEEAQRLVAYMSGPAGQRVLAGTDASQYAVGNGVLSGAALKPFSELSPPDVDLNTLNGPQVVSEMQRVGLL